MHEWRRSVDFEFIVGNPLIRGIDCWLSCLVRIVADLVVDALTSEKAIFETYDFCSELYNV